MTPQKIGRYEIKSELGRGGMATVFRAYDPRFERDVALKVLPREFLHDPSFRARFEREAKTIAALEHPAIVPVYDLGEENGQPYLVMRYMPGGSLADRLQKGTLPVTEAVEVLRRIGSALDRAHSQGVIHRDLKPGNILFDRYGDSYLADFGIVKLTQQTATFTGSAVIGTPAYMSPEQAKGEAQLDGRSDIYALGAILFEMLTGKQPYEADTPMGLAVKHIVEPVPRILEVKPDLPPGCAKVIERAMAKDREARYHQASELVETLSQTTMAAPVPSSPPSTISPDGDETDLEASPPAIDSSSEPEKPTGDILEPATELSKSGIESASISKKKRWLSILLMALGWGIGLLIGVVITESLTGFGPAVAGLIGGGSTGFVLRRIEPAIRWKQILAITIGWLVGFSIVFAGIGNENAFTALIGTIIGGLVTGLTLRQVKASIRWKQVLIVTGGWLISFFIVAILSNGLTGAFGEILALAIIGAIYGAIGGGVMFWQLDRS